MKQYNKTGIILLFFIFAAVILFQSCNQNQDPLMTRQANKIGVNSQNYPRIDGSTSVLSIIQEIYKSMYNPELIDDKETWNGLPAEAAQTVKSYKMLIDGSLDLIIVPDPSEEVKSMANENGVELEYIPVCVEALIFIAHKETPVNNISAENLKSIYTDMQINNWYQLGGGDYLKIEALTRNTDSGSYALLEKFVLDGEEVNEKIYEYRQMLSMFTIVDEIENFINGDKSENTDRHPLGYTLYYFFQNNKEIQKWDDIKILSVDEVEPNSQTIISKEYPYSTNYYVVIKKDTPKNSPVRKLVEWLLSPEGQNVFINAGFGAINE